MIQTRGERTFVIFSAIVMIVLTVFAFLPFLLIVIASFTDETTLIRNGYSFFPEKTSLDAYLYIKSTAYTFIRAYGVSFLVTILGTGFGLLITSMCQSSAFRESPMFLLPFSSVGCFSR